MPHCLLDNDRSSRYDSAKVPRPRQFHLLGIRPACASSVSLSKPIVCFLFSFFLVLSSRFLLTVYLSTSSSSSAPCSSSNTVWYRPISPPPLTPLSQQQQQDERGNEHEAAKQKADPWRREEAEGCHAVHEPFTVLPFAISVSAFFAFSSFRGSSPSRSPSLFEVLLSPGEAPSKLPSNKSVKAAETVREPSTPWATMHTVSAPGRREGQHRLTPPWSCGNSNLCGRAVMRARTVLCHWRFPQSQRPAEPSFRCEAGTLSRCSHACPLPPILLLPPACTRLTLVT